MKKEIEKDFQDFCESKSHVSSSWGKEILDHVYKDLNPNKLILVLKLFLIHVFVGGITLLFCPQFELSLTSNVEFYHFFHRHFGIYVCTAVCGALFMASGACLAGFILRFSELKILFSSKYLLHFLMSGMALLSFFILGARIPLELAFAWMFGGVTSSLVAIQVGWQLRVARLSRS